MNGGETRVRKIPGAWPSTSAWAARGYRRFSKIPAERRNLIWKLNIVMAVIWAFTLKFAISTSLSLALDRREGAEWTKFLTHQMPDRT